MCGAPTEVREVAAEDMPSRLHFATTQEEFLAWQMPTPAGVP